MQACSFTSPSGFLSLAVVGFGVYSDFLVIDICMSLFCKSVFADFRLRILSNIKFYHFNTVFHLYFHDFDSFQR